MRPKKRELHELPYKKNCTIRGLLDSPYAFFGPNLHGNQILKATDLYDIINKSLFPPVALLAIML